MENINIQEAVERLKAEQGQAIELISFLAGVPLPVIELARRQASWAFGNIDSTAPTAVAPAVPAPRKRGRPKKTEAAA